MKRGIVKAQEEEEDYSERPARERGVEANVKKIVRYNTASESECIQFELTSTDDPQ